MLTRNGQPLAAMQYRGRLLDTWTEIVYDGRGYRMSYVKDEGRPASRVLVDEGGDESLFVEGGRAPQVELLRPLPLLVMAAMRILDEGERGKLESRN
ncbi:MAG: hypothetical protein V3S14_05155 [Anaerolineae bacterium]